MRPAFIISTILFIAQLISAANVIGYFTNWGIYGDQPYTAECVPYQKLTHIQYAFFKPETNGDISSFDSYADEQILLGEMVWSPAEHHDSTTSLIYLAHKNNVKVLASIGGWTGSSNFPAMVYSAVSRSNFCSKVRALIEQYKFDGIDIDWEYPCFAEHNGTPADANNFVLLLAELRDTLDAMAGNKKLITLAIPGGSYHGQNFLIEQFHQDVDYISIMTYDYTGAWAEYAWHSSPLYDYGSSDNWSLNKAMEYYISRGIPASKLNIGMAFYGKTFLGCEGPNKSFTGTEGETGSIDYSIIVEKIKSGNYIRCWDEAAKVPYCLTSANEYCSYDDTVSIRLKAEYCVKKGYAGAIIWELKSGTLKDGSQPLLNAAASVLIPGTTVRKMGVAMENHPGKLRIKYSSSGIAFQFYNGKSSHIKFSVYDLTGKTAFELNGLFLKGYHDINLPEAGMLSSGKYLLKIKADNKDHQIPFSVIR